MYPAISRPIPSAHHKTLEGFRFKVRTANTRHENVREMGIPVRHWVHVTDPRHPHVNEHIAASTTTGLRANEVTIEILRLLQELAEMYKTDSINKLTQSLFNRENRLLSKMYAAAHHVRGAQDYIVESIMFCKRLGYWNGLWKKLNFRYEAENLKLGQLIPTRKLNTWEFTFVELRNDLRYMIDDIYTNPTEVVTLLSKVRLEVNSRTSQSMSEQYAFGAERKAIQDIRDLQLAWLVRLNLLHHLLLAIEKGNVQPASFGRRVGHEHTGV